MRRSRQGDVVDLVELEVKFVTETKLAILVEHSEDKAPVWLPKSAVEYPRNPARGQTMIVDVPTNLAQEKGLI